MTAPEDCASVLEQFIYDAANLPANAAEPSHSTENVTDFETGHMRPPIQRRRSSLRSRFSLNGTGKVVSWAMDRDWSEHMAKFDHIVYGAEVASKLSFCLQVSTTSDIIR